jgi:hypothetical protein
MMVEGGLVVAGVAIITLLHKWKESLHETKGKKEG